MRRGRPGKRAAILAAAGRVFGRDGYARAGIDAIAAEAGVSTRTIYHHFDGKDDLFSAVVTASTAQVADTLTELIAAHLNDPAAPPHRALVALAHDWIAAQAEFADHFAMVRQINIEATHVPAAALHTWHETGPARVMAALTNRLAAMARQGTLRVFDAERAASHYLLLTVAAIDAASYHGAVPLPAAETTAIITTGVTAFLDGYRPRAQDTA
ncbi:hypothetical protein GCM10009541_29410 [Micromonospora gifhornensis]|uniref:HTH tetR-type domain-containing protein n=1 Tax=Micromonospora gifhornensis TaxID=84594 RepID=A0ABQ4I8F6_9ACTN|nr:TetR/AcrR family transcriptional regulator [Micromonospora gifhornensis]GIJ14174.1 hypothetical protein Vgi01_08580 [Micromonospora gifhornensis]